METLHSLLPKLARPDVKNGTTESVLPFGGTEKITVNRLSPFQFHISHYQEDYQEKGPSDFIRYFRLVNSYVIDYK